MFRIATTARRRSYATYGAHTPRRLLLQRELDKQRRLRAKLHVIVATQDAIRKDKYSALEDDEQKLRLLDSMMYSAETLFESNTRRIAALENALCVKDDTWDRVMFYDSKLHAARLSARQALFLEDIKKRDE